VTEDWTHAPGATEPRMEMAAIGGVVLLRSSSAPEKVISLTEAEWLAFMTGLLPRTDPREIPGSMAGPGGPHDPHGVVLDARNAVLLETIDVSTVDPERGGRGRSALALVLGGRINQTQDRASVLFIFGTDGAAGIITELIGVMDRASGSEFVAGFMADLSERLRGAE